RKLEKSEQRPAPETRIQMPELPEVADRRPVSASLTCGNVDASPYWGKFTSETELPGWGTWIRTSINGVRGSTAAPPAAAAYPYLWSGLRFCWYDRAWNGPG